MFIRIMHMRVDIVMKIQVWLACSEQFKFHQNIQKMNIIDQIQIKFFLYQHCRIFMIFLQGTNYIQFFLQYFQNLYLYWMVITSKIYKIRRQQATIQLNKKIDNPFLIDVMQNDASFVGVVKSNSTVYLINESGQTRLSHSMDANSSNFVDLSATSLGYYSATNNKIIALNLVTFEVEERNINIQPDAPRNQFQLFHFKQIHTYALIEKNNVQSKLNVWYLNLQDGTYTATANFITEDNVWKAEQKIYKANDFGLIAWGSIEQNNSNIHLCTRQGFSMGSLSSVISGYSQIGAITNDGSDKLHIALFNHKSDTLPVVVVQTSNNFSIFKKDTLIQNTAQVTFSQIKEIYSLGDFIAFKATINENDKVFIYGLETQTIVESYFLKESSIIRESLLAKGALIQILFQREKQELSLISHSIKRQNNLQLKKLLEAHNKILKISETKDKAVIIFGTTGSGKSTYIGYLCQKELQHIYHQDLAYYQLRIKENAEKMQNEADKNLFIEVQQNKLGALIEIPDWSQSQQLKSHIMLLLQAVLKHFKSLHIVVTIPYEQIQQIQIYQKILEQLIDLAQKSNLGLKDIQLGEIMSILLTKLEDSSGSQLFKDNIEYLKEENEVVGTLLERINDKQRIISFENKPFDTHQGEEASTNLFGADMLVIEKKANEQSKNNLVETQDGKNTQQSLYYELNFYGSLINKFFLYLSYITVDIPSQYRLDLLQEQSYHVKKLTTLKSKDSLNQDKNQLTYSFFIALSELKIILQNKANQTVERILNLQKSLQTLAKEYEKLTSFADCEQLRMAFNCFISSVIVWMDYFPEYSTLKFDQAISSLRNEQNGILGNTFKPVIQKLRQNQLVSNQKAILQQLTQYLGKTSGRPIVRVVKVQLSYEKEREVYLKDRSKIIDTICSLPANAMKLDLILEQIAEYVKKQKVENQDIKKLRYYLRQGSRICHFHELYSQAITLLMVIPDFIGMEIILDEMVQNYKKKNPIDSKKLLSKEEQELVEELKVMCRNCVRDGLVSKLIYITSLNKQINSKQMQVKKIQTMSKSRWLSNKENIDKYLQRLQNKTQLIYYNIKNQTFKDLIERRRDVIQRCIRYQNEQNPTKFADIQALNWVVEKVPIPASI